MEGGIKEIIEEYQCPGCVNGINSECYQEVPAGNNLECEKHIIEQDDSIKKVFSKISCSLPRLSL